MSFKLLFTQTGKLLLIYLMEVRGLYFSIISNRKRPIKIRILPGLNIKYAAEGDIAQILFKNEILLRHKKSFEYTTLEKFKHLIKEGDIIIDVGANSGLYSILFSKLVGSGGKVYAFEPDKCTFHLLEKNLFLNNCQNVDAYNFALSNKQSQIEMISFNTDVYNLQSGDSFKYMKEVLPSSVSENTSQQMMAYKMDDITEVKALNKIDFIKIDVEGAEMLVIEGAIETISKFKPLIIFELSGEWTARFNYKPYQLLLLLHKIGYDLEEFDFQQWIAQPLNKANSYY